MSDNYYLGKKGAKLIGKLETRKHFDMCLYHRIFWIFFIDGGRLYDSLRDCEGCSEKTLGEIDGWRVPDE